MKSYIRICLDVFGKLFFDCILSNIYIYIVDLLAESKPQYTYIYIIIMHI